jgi:hypothetical protein
MSSLRSSSRRSGRHGPTEERGRRWPAARSMRSSGGRHVATTGLRAAVGISLPFSASALRPVLRAIAEIGSWIPFLGGLIAYAGLRPRLTDAAGDDRPAFSSLAHTSNRFHQEVSHQRTPPDPQTNRPRMGRLLDRRPGGRSLPRSWFEVARAALPRQRHERPVGPGCRQNAGFTAKGSHRLVGLRRETVRLGYGSGFAGPAPSQRVGVPRRLAVALLALGCVLSLLAPNQSWASSLVARHATHTGSPQPHQARHAQVLPRTAGVAPSRPDVRSTADGAFVLVVLVLTLNSAGMLVRVASSPPSWMKD